MGLLSNLLTIATKFPVEKFLYKRKTDDVAAILEFSKKIEEEKVNSPEPAVPQVKPSFGVSTEETILYQKRELSKELLLLEKHLQQGCKIAGTPCDCCLVPGTKIYGNPAPVAIESPSQSVLTHKGRIRPVTQTFEREYAGVLNSLRVGYTSFPLLLTPEHPVLIARNSTWGLLKGILERDLRWVPASELTDCDFMVFPRLKGVEMLNPSESLIYQTTSETKIYQLRRDLFGMGILHSLSFRPISDGFIYEIQITGDAGDPNGNHGQISDNYAFLPVIENLTVPYSGKVRNIAVAEDESYITAHGVIHNCMKHPIAIEALAQEGLGLNGDMVFSEINNWVKQISPMVTEEASKSGKFDDQYKDVAVEARGLRKRLMGTSDVSVLLSKEQKEDVGERARQIIDQVIEKKKEEENVTKTEV